MCIRDRVSTQSTWGLLALARDRFNAGELKRLWDFVAGEGRRISKGQFRHIFSADHHFARSSPGRRRRRSHSARHPRNPPLADVSEAIPPEPWEGEQPTDSLVLLRKITDRLRRQRHLASPNQSSPTDIAILFEELDRRGDGYLSREDFGAAVRRTGVDISEEELERLVSYLDRNGDGLINWRDFLQRYIEAEALNLDDRTKGTLTRLAALLRRYMHTEAEAFDLYDHHGEGRLSLREFTLLVHQALEYAGQRRPPATMIRSLFDRLDFKRDNAIDWDEWAQAFGLRERPPKRKRPAEAHEGLQSSVNYERIVRTLLSKRRRIEQTLEQMRTLKVHVDASSVQKVLAESLWDDRLELTHAQWNELLSPYTRNDTVNIRLLFDSLQRRLSLLLRNDSIF
eukprot:TRINITY_DN7670_c0_g2_i1.p1 TRINITY_DN7670_c0_g2~~TRINITY_DN7670_c0_g2_i1.p1  ORF type:complete len:414 (-),score=90.44 TRINITY_DN7670_c0_g2_i1:145-1338(-)